jgi:tRNA pseudouridine55 synthase
LATTSEPGALLAGAAYLMDKPRGFTSRRAGASAARSWGFRKYGHAGTLDPDATGLLIVLLGKATRLSRFITADSKRYAFGVRLGVVTDTDDLTGQILQTRGAEGISTDALMEALEALTGDILQKVPAFSAVRVGGVRSYRIARQGLTPDTPVRGATVSGWRIESMELPDIRLSVTVSAGTYVRALARDLGAALGTGGAAFDIRRLSVGAFSVEEASESPDDPRSMMDMSSLLRRCMPLLVLDPAEAGDAAAGRPLASRESGTVGLLDRDGTLVGVGEGDGTVIRPMCVLAGT